MIKCIICDLYNVLVFPIIGEKYSPLSFNFESSLETNNGLLDFLKHLPVRKVIFTSMDKVSLDTQLVAYFNSYDFEIIEASKLGLDKSSTYAYEYLVKNLLGLSFAETMFIDDQPDNVGAALKTGIDAILYNNEFERERANNEIETKLKTVGFS